MDKKGAIEMSMQTIIVVVIGVTLLTLGLRFVYTTFSGVGSQQQKISEITESQLGELFGESEEPIALTTDNIKIKQGKSSTIDVLVRNTGASSGNFKYSVTPIGSSIEGKTGNSKWFVGAGISAGKSLAPGKGYKDSLLITIPSATTPATYLFEVKLFCPAEVCPTDAPPSASLTIEVTS